MACSARPNREPRADMEARDVIEIVELLEGAAIEVWLDGGWGVDALLAEQTCPHDDLDLVVPRPSVSRLQALVAERGYVLVGRGAPSCFEMTDENGRQVDVHPVRFEASGDGVYRMRNGGDWIHPARGFSGLGRVGGRAVRCLTPEVQMLCHTGYELPAKQVDDLAALSDRFGLAVPSAP